MVGAAAEVIKQQKYKKKKKSEKGQKYSNIISKLIIGIILLLRY